MRGCQKDKKKHLLFHCNFNSAIDMVFLDTFGLSRDIKKDRELKYVSASRVIGEDAVTHEQYLNRCISITDQLLNPLNRSLIIRLRKHLNHLPCKIVDNKSKCYVLHRHATKHQIRHALLKCEVCNAALCSGSASLYFIQKTTLRNWLKK